MAPDFRFLHLERRRVDQALPDLLERQLEKGQRIVVHAASPEEVEAVNERLWVYAEDSFLPHGSKRDGEPEDQPIYLTDEADNPNGASVRVLLPGVDASTFVGSTYERVFVLFDGRDDEALSRARREWTKVKASGKAMSYWREGDDGGWVKAR